MHWFVKCIIGDQSKQVLNEKVATDPHIDSNPDIFRQIEWRVSLDH